MIATEFIEYIINRKTKINGIFLLTTSEKDMITLSNRTKEILELKYKFLGNKIDIIKFEFRDAIRYEDFYEVIEKIIEKADKNTYFNLAGGRKNITIAAYIAACLLGARAYHVIMPDIKSINIEFERLKEDILRGNITDENGKLRKDIESIFFPPLNRFEVIEIPVIPIRLLSILIREIFRENYIHPLLIEDLKRLGYIQIVGNRIHLTNEGKLLHEILEKYIYK